MSEKRRSVLVVDDDPDIFPLINTYLGGEYFLSRALSYVEAEAALVAKRFDVVVLDQQLGGDRSGTDLLRAIRAGGHLEGARDVPVVMLTAQRGQEVFEASWDLGSTAYITKPFDLPKLARAIEEAIGQAELG